ncbi:hypothetical protein RKD23_005114 [Streptomyces sp. SAI-170]|uniref:hypothetical protein n=1 Tax=Streptomyces sp. SAI-170 TaxID=3377729 RepID=UPI003C7A2206
MMVLLAGPAFLAAALGAVLAVVAVLSAALPGRPEDWRRLLVRRAAWLAATGAAAVYLWGAFGVAASESAFGDGADSVPAPACRDDDIPPETVEGLSHHRASYLPLAFDCVREDGSVYTSDPYYGVANRTAPVLAVTAALLAIGAGYASELRLRRAAPAAPGRPQP